MPVSDNFIGPVNPNNVYELDWMKIPVVYGDREPGATGFTQSGGTSELSLHIGSQWLDDYILAATGWAKPHRSVGATASGNAIEIPEYSGINRALPIAHPRYPFMYCSGVQSVQGMKFQRMTDYAAWEQSELDKPNEGMLAPAFPVFPEYTMYDVKLGFSARSYKVWPNTEILFRRKHINYYPPNADFTVTVKDVWPEWERFTFTQPEPKFETLSAQQGSYHFWTPPGPLAVAGLGPITQVGQIKIPYPSTKLAVTWFNVPYRFTTGEGVYGNKGDLVNKTVFEYAAYTVNQYEFLGKPAGTLLFEGVQISEPQVRPFPSVYEEPPGSGKYAYENIFTCDITMFFLHRDPKAEIDYAGLGYEPGGTINTYNNVYAGHNLLPDARIGKYYAGVYTQALDGAKQVVSQTAQNTIYPSFPHELLFTDPAYTIPFLP